MTTHVALMFPAAHYLSELQTGPWPLLMKRQLFKPKWSEPCLCGSGKKFKDCCWQRLPGFDIGKQYLQAIKERKLERALLACRADIVQYTIWHKTNTEPVLFRGGPALKLLQIDVNALAAYVERLLWLYIHTGRIADWLSVLDRMRDHIRHTKWQRKIAYFRALSYLGPNDDRAKARQELKKVGSVTVDEDDVELLQLYIDIELDDEPFSKRLAFLDRILTVSDERSDQLQYRGAKAIQYFLIGDSVTADRELAEAIELYRTTEADDPLNDYERNLAGRLLQFLGSIRHDAGLIREAMGHFNTLLLGDNWTKNGRAALHREVGDCHKFSGAWNDAETSYREALALANVPLDLIHLSECLLYQKRIEEAVTQTGKVDRASLGRHEFEDYVFAFSAIAIWSSNETLLKDAKNLLESLGGLEPYFNERRLNLLLRVTETLASGKASPEAKADSTPDGGVASAASSFILLQPNVMGIGINFNAIIDYLLKKKPRK